MESVSIAFLMKELNMRFILLKRMILEIFVNTIRIAFDRSLIEAHM